MYPDDHVALCDVVQDVTLVTHWHVLRIASISGMHRVGA